MTKIINPNAAASRAPIRVAVCVPAGDTVNARFAYDLARMLAFTVRQRTDVDVYLNISQGQHTAELRTSLALDALEAEGTHALFLAPDLRFPRTLLLDLLAHRQPVVGATYVTRSTPCEPTAVSRGGPLWIAPEMNGLSSVQVLGLGCMLVDLDVLRALPTPWFVPGVTRRGEYLGEEVYFCGKLQEAGLTVYADLTLSHQIAHVGQWEYRHAHALALEEMEKREAPADGAQHTG